MCRTLPPGARSLWTIRGRAVCIEDVGYVFATMPPGVRLRADRPPPGPGL
ncbi:hypothetical protein [Nannocystis bainbridge]|uniref:Uncharacterized protein n=1 Tax=Nannocystis bainbridge TaxID=2995303 RepID=A0ABT5DSP8_9BACT|nr:hypothetical protein [Nannocystis bainbridge]MDC0716662.1 hypothetical protein [Nannocystis bainbridge]